MEEHRRPRDRRRRRRVHRLVQPSASFSVGRGAVARRFVGATRGRFCNASPGLWCSWLVVVHDTGLESRCESVRAFPVALPSGVRYWTVLDEDLVVVGEADAFLRHLRFGRDASELTTRSYACGIALYLRWCRRTGRSWQAGVGTPRPVRDLASARAAGGERPGCGHRRGADRSRPTSGEGGTSDERGLDRGPWPGRARGHDRRRSRRTAPADL